MCPSSPVLDTPGLRLASDLEAVPKRSEPARSAVEAVSYLRARGFGLLATAIQGKLRKDIIPMIMSSSIDIFSLASGQHGS